MADWPKTIYIRGVGIPVASWEELDEIIQRYGSQMVVTLSGEPESTGRKTTSGSRAVALSHVDRALLRQFVDGGSRGVLNKDLAHVLGAPGRSIRPAIRAWSERIGLVNEGGASPFAPVMRADGRGYSLTNVSMRVARTILGMEE